jgi:hypothetical protein
MLSDRHQEQRDLAIGVLLSIAQDTDQLTEERMSAAQSVVEATNPSPYVDDRDPEVDDQTLNALADRIAERLVARVDEESA